MAKLLVMGMLLWSVVHLFFSSRLVPTWFTLLRMVGGECNVLIRSVAHGLHLSL